MPQNQEYNMLFEVPNVIVPLLPAQCLDRHETSFFISLPVLLTAGCFKAALAKGLGYLIIAGSLIIQLPQILTVLRAHSAEGLNLPSLALQVFACIAGSAYGYVNHFPFSAYGDTVFLGLQLVALSMLTLHYRQSDLGALVFGALCSACAAYLLSPLVYAPLVAVMQAAVVPTVVVAKLLQVWSNWCKHSTGQLSLVSTFLMLGGSAARVFTSVQETGDMLLVATYALGSSCNAILLAQIAYYWPRGARTSSNAPAATTASAPVDAAGTAKRKPVKRD